MREIIKKFNVYQYSELSDEAKAKVRSWYVDDPVRSENYQMEPIFHLRLVRIKMKK